MGASYSVQHIEAPSSSHLESLDINGNFILEQTGKAATEQERWRKNKDNGQQKAIQSQPKLTIRSYTWTKESHGLFDYDLKDVLEATEETTESTNILRNELAVTFGVNTIENLIAKIARSGTRHWWIYHQNSYSGANHQA